MRNTIKNISFIFLIICVTNIFYHPSQAREISGTKGSKIFGEIISTFNQPWAISFINSNTMLVTTKGGMLWLVDSSGFKKSIKLLKWRPKYNNLKLILKSAFKWEKKIKKS